MITSGEVFVMPPAAAAMLAREATGGDLPRLMVINGVRPLPGKKEYLRDPDGVILVLNVENMLSGKLREAGREWRRMLPGWRPAVILAVTSETDYELARAMWAGGEP